MIRFVDLGKQLSLDEDDPEEPRMFAFWDTVHDEFVSAHGEEAWDSWLAFSFALEGNESDLDRFRGLCPAWVFRN